MNSIPIIWEKKSVSIFWNQRVRRCWRSKSLTLKELYVEHSTTKDLADQFSKNGEDANGQRGTSAALSGSFRHSPNSGAYFRMGQDGCL